MRLEFGARSSRPVSTFNFNYERQEALNAALLKKAAPDLPPSSSGAVRTVRRLMARAWSGVWPALTQEKAQGRARSDGLH